jgi:UDPglucose 6-dehydrogenase
LKHRRRSIGVDPVAYGRAGGGGGGQRVKIAVMGCGYVGLVTGACLADVGNDVLCIDVDAQRVARLRQGESPIHEPGLERLLARGAAAQRLRFGTDAAEAVAHAVLVFIAVGTPSGEDGSADLSHVLSCARSLGQHIARDTLVVVKSTVPVGTSARVCAELRAQLAARAVPHRVTTASNPEFLKEGLAVEDFMRPDRIVIGLDEDDQAAAESLRRLYAPFNRYRDRMLFMSTRSAEFTKYAANCMLATRISFMNELANLADRIGVDIEQVRHGIGADPRIGPHFLYAGAGFGGSCFPKDLRALIHMSAQADEPAELLRAATRVNQRQRGILVEKINAFFGGELAGRTVALWGLAFKANTDDVREASSLTVIDGLTRAGARVRAYDPVALDTARAALGANPAVEFVSSAEQALNGADVLAVVTEWREFRSPDFDVLAQKLAARAIFDGRNLYDPAAVRAAGLAYFGIGRGR